MTAAAVIMISVFAAFVPHGDMSVKPVALGLAVGVFVDAFLVRMMLVPAVLTLLGDRAWWLPRWLDRRLPVLDVEGVGITHHLEHEEWTQDARAGRRTRGERVRPRRHGPRVAGRARPRPASSWHRRTRWRGRRCWRRSPAASTSTDASSCSTGCCPPSPRPYGDACRCWCASPRGNTWRSCVDEPLVVVDHLDDDLASPDEVDARWQSLRSLADSGTTVVAGAVRAPDDADVLNLAPPRLQEASL